LNKKEADLKAKELLGDTAFAIRISHKDRNQRFGIVLVDSGAANCVGFGPSFDAAIKMTIDDINKLKAISNKEEVK
jgi:hypothetical protein